jgi:septum formation protein
MTKIILASSSPQRKDLLNQLGVTFEIIPSNFDEDSVKKIAPKEYVKKLARCKAEFVASTQKEGVIIGVDTVITLNNEIIGKPKDEEDATRTLRKLSGKTHNVVSGICVINKYLNKTVTSAVVTKVKFRKLNDKLIKEYIKSKEPLNKAGSYGIQGKGAILIEEINGDYYNIVGLPLTTLAKILESMKLI